MQPNGCCFRIVVSAPRPSVPKVKAFCFQVLFCGFQGMVTCNENGLMNLPMSPLHVVFVLLPGS